MQKSMNKKFIGPGVVTTASGGPKVGMVNNTPENAIIADGKNIIISFNLPGSKGMSYFCLKNVGLRDFHFNIAPDDIPQGQLDFHFFDSESKSFDIPDHIPKEQHTKYIKEQFDLED